MNQREIQLGKAHAREMRVGSLQTNTRRESQLVALAPRSVLTAAKRSCSRQRFDNFTEVSPFMRGAAVLEKSKRQGSNLALKPATE